MNNFISGLVTGHIFNNIYIFTFDITEYLLTRLNTAVPKDFNLYYASKMGASRSILYIIAFKATVLKYWYKSNK